MGSSRGKKKTFRWRKDRAAQAQPQNNKEKTDKRVWEEVSTWKSKNFAQKKTSTDGKDRSASFDSHAIQEDSKEVRNDDVGNEWIECERRMSMKMAQMFFRKMNVWWVVKNKREKTMLRNAAKRFLKNRSGKGILFSSQSYD